MVTPLGLGCAELGIESVRVQRAIPLLEGVLAAGINVLDTAECYGESEAILGESIGQRRDEFVLMTKCGHSVNGTTSPAWTGELVRESIDRSLVRLRTDHVDVLLLHSCPSQTLRHEDLLRAMQEARDQGKTQAIGYSGDNEAAALAVAMGLFDVLEISLNIVDQQAIDRVLPQARAAEMGIVIKRPLANACWRPSTKDSFYAQYGAEYARRLERMSFQPADIGFAGEWPELALRFAVHTPGVSTAIVGSTTLSHVHENIDAVNKGPLSDKVLASLRQLWRHHDDGSWVGQG